jgi:hypothetical protein
MLRGRRQQTFQGRVGQLSACCHDVIEHDGEYNKWPSPFAGAMTISNEKDAPSGRP